MSCVRSDRSRWSDSRPSRYLKCSTVSVEAVNVLCTFSNWAVPPAINGGVNTQQYCCREGTNSPNRMLYFCSIFWEYVQRIVYQYHYLGRCDGCRAALNLGRSTYQFTKSFIYSSLMIRFVVYCFDIFIPSMSKLKLTFTEYILVACWGT